MMIFVVVCHLKKKNKENYKMVTNERREREKEKKVS
jgi:hypothetical protein